MTVFSSLKAARQEGFVVTDYHKELQLWGVERTRINVLSGRREKEMAFANSSDN